MKLNMLIRNTLGAVVSTLACHFDDHEQDIIRASRNPLSKAISIAKKRIATVPNAKGKDEYDRDIAASLIPAPGQTLEGLAT